MTDSVMSADKPSLQVSEDEMDDWHKFLGNLRITFLGDGEMFIATFRLKFFQKTAIFRYETPAIEGSAF